MLVLSRQQDQKVLFPNLGITVEIVGIKGRNVKLGIDAPPEIRILRDEIADEWNFKEREKASGGSEAEQAQNASKNQLDQIGLMVQAAQEKLEKGFFTEAIEHLASALTDLSNLDQSLLEKPAESVREKSCGYTTQSPHATDSPVQHSALPSTSKWKALLVEENANEWSLLATTLEMGGIAVDVVGNGEEAIEYLLANEQPDFVLIDMEMPKLAGPATIEYIRRNLEFSDLAIYGVSGVNRSPSKLDFGNNGVSDWFAKPVDAGQMIEGLCDALGNSQEMQIN